MRKKVLVRAPVLSRSGYGEQSRFAIRSLRSREDLFDIYLTNVGWGQTGMIADDNDERKWLDHIIQKTLVYQHHGGQFDISLQVTIPNEWEKLAPVNIGYTAGIETTKVAPEWLMNANKMDKIIVISNFAKEGFYNTSYPVKNKDTDEIVQHLRCTTPIEAVNYPYKEYKPEKVDIDFETNFNFLVVAQWSIRKNIENTVKWFVEEFKNINVGLILKLNTKNNCIMDRKHTEARLKNLLDQYKDMKCKVYFLHGDFTDEQMTDLYRHKKIKAMISLAHGEGFGLPLFEAAYNGLPIISPAWGGQLDFLYAPIEEKGKVRRRAHFAGIEYEIAPVQDEAVWNGVLIKDSMWAYAKKASYASALRKMHSNYGYYKKLANNLKDWVQEEFKAEKQYEKFCSPFLDYVEEEDDSWMDEIDDIVKEYA